MEDLECCEWLKDRAFADRNPYRAPRSQAHQIEVRR
jgi:hypothetical protein